MSKADHCSLHVTVPKATLKRCHQGASLNAVSTCGAMMLQTEGSEKEIIVRGTHDCWVVARHLNGQELYIVLEGKGEVGLAGAAKLAHSFTETNFAGRF